MDDFAGLPNELFLGGQESNGGADPGVFFGVPHDDSSSSNLFLQAQAQPTFAPPDQAGPSAFFPVQHSGSFGSFAALGQTQGQWGSPVVPSTAPPPASLFPGLTPQKDPSPFAPEANSASSFGSLNFAGMGLGGEDSAPLTHQLPPPPILQPPRFQPALAPSFAQQMAAFGPSSPVPEDPSTGLFQPKVEAAQLPSPPAPAAVQSQPAPSYYASQPPQARQVQAQPPSVAQSSPASQPASQPSPQPAAKGKFTPTVRSNSPPPTLPPDAPLPELEANVKRLQRQLKVRKKSSAQCSGCGKAVKPQSLETHLFGHFPKHLFACRRCSRFKSSANSFTAAASHANTVHGQTLANCMEDFRPNYDARLCGLLRELFPLGDLALAPVRPFPPPTAQPPVVQTHFPPPPAHLDLPQANSTVTAVDRLPTFSQRLDKVRAWTADETPPSTAHKPPSERPHSPIDWSGGSAAAKKKKSSLPWVTSRPSPLPHIPAPVLPRREPPPTFPAFQSSPSCNFAGGSSQQAAFQGTPAPGFPAPVGVQLPPQQSPAPALLMPVTLSPPPPMELPAQTAQPPSSQPSPHPKAPPTNLSAPLLREAAKIPKLRLKIGGGGAKAEILPPKPSPVARVFPKLTFAQVLAKYRKPRSRAKPLLLRLAQTMRRRNAVGRERLTRLRKAGRGPQRPRRSRRPGRTYLLRLVGWLGWPCWQLRQRHLGAFLEAVESWLTQRSTPKPVHCLLCREATGGLGVPLLIAEPDLPVWRVSEKLRVLVHHALRHADGHSVKRTAARDRQLFVVRLLLQAYRFH